jgi:HD-like signal output (HDOD) protein
MATNEDADEESLGGAEMHSRVSGVSDYLAEDELDAIRLGRDIVEILLSQLHEEIGSHVLDQWEMPPAIVSAAGAHHRYVGATHAVPAQQLIHAANLICQHLGIGEEQRDIDFNLQRVFVDLGLADVERVDEILATFQSELSDLMSGFGGSGAPGADRAA